MRIYIACLASYNNGILHGEWIDADSDVDVMQEEVDRILRESPCPNVSAVDWEATARQAGWTRNANNGYFVGPIGHATRMADYDDWKELCEDNSLEPVTVPSAEEWAIHDYENMANLGEHASLSDIARYVELAEDFGSQHGPHEAETIVASLVKSQCGNLEYAEEMVSEFRGVYDSFRDFSDALADGMLDADCGDFLSRYFDYDAFARDLRYEYGVVELPGGAVAIFHS